ncbi:DEAD/DEAH box helicase [Chloroflexota bacterium]
MNVRNHLKPELSSLLRPYQRKGINFLLRKRGCLLADEMGLGKTVQVATALSLLIPKSNLGRALVVVPAALRMNWEQELGKWAPRLSVRRIRGDTQERHANYHLPINVLICSYEQVRQDSLFLSNEIHFDILVLDEAQRIKNVNSATALAVRTLRRDRSWAMTGTPVENSVNDLFSIFRFVKLGLLNKAMTKNEMHETMKPYFMRRRKRDVLKDMPPIILQDIPLELSEKQEQTYKEVWNNRYDILKGKKNRISSSDIFSLITKLKQICNFEPSTNESSKLEALKLIIDNLSNREDKLIVFSQYVETLKIISESLNSVIACDIYHGGLSENERNRVLTLFKNEQGPRILLMSLKAGGVGLNLQEASSIVLFDRWWNPAVEEQAINRGHRFGRTDVLHVFQFFVVNSIEERIINILSDKKSIIEQYVNQAEIAEIPDLNMKDLMNIVDVHID